MGATTNTAPSDTPVASRRVFSIPNLLSFARLSTVPVFLWLWVSGRQEAAVILYGIGASTDFLDGYIARRTDSVTELGKLLDPFADRVFIVALAVALVASDTLWGWLAVVVVGRDVVVLAAYPLLQKHGLHKIPVNMVGKTATACLLFGLTSLAWSETTFVGAGIGDVMGLGFVVAGAVLYWAAGAMYAREALHRVRAGSGGSPG